MKTITTAIALLIAGISFSQTTATTFSRPKLVVGVVIDQMRYDYLYRYNSKYSDNGFKRLLREGYSCENTHINYSPSYTACGHTSVYTGSIPAVHGIVGNNWFDLTEEKYVYCTDDSTVRGVGCDSKAGRMSPRRMLATTITDELRLATNFKSKTIGVAIKDRGSILPAGHAANAAYFYDPNCGNWITSTYYMKELPAWVSQFNEQKFPDKYLKNNWNTLLPLESYTESTTDDVPYEETFKNETKSVFPHKVGEAANPAYKILASTPFGNSVTLKFAQSAIANEQLGTGSFTDFLAVSLSSTDYIGHLYGPNSIEVEDTYLRLDKDLEEFFNFLDTKVGKGNYLLFLTADHAGAHVPDFMNEHGIPAGVFAMDSVVKQLNVKLQAKYGAGKWVWGYENMQLYLNNKLIAEKKLNRNELKAEVKNYVTQFAGILKVLDLENMANELQEKDSKNAIINGYHPKRSGDLYVLFEPGWFEDMTKGTTHGTVYRYDTHIPLIWYGWKIKPGEDHSDVHITDIAPTVAAMLHIQEPNGCVGKVISGTITK